MPSGVAKRSCRAALAACWLLSLSMLVHAGANDSVAAASLAERIHAAKPGAVIHLAPGTYQGPITLTKPLTLEGEPGAIIQGDGEHTVIKVDAKDAVVRGLTVRGSGRSLADMDAGITLTKAARGAVVEANRLEDNLFGIHVAGAPDALVTHNTVIGMRDPHMSERGDGIYIWNAPGTQIIGNHFRYGQDGIFSTTSKHNLFADNRFEDLRYAVHYMYTNDSTVRGNVSVNNHAGYVVMYSSRVEVLQNVSRNDRDHGILLNFANYSKVEGNAVINGGEKCVFIYNANFNSIQDNRFKGCQIGVHFTAGSESNTLVGNAFINNRTQVKYVGTRNLRWSEKGRGNFWSDQVAFDLDGDGIADQPYRPNGLVDQLMWRTPEAKLLMSSPAVQLLRWMQSAFPSIQPGGVVDEAPLMHPPELAPNVAREDQDE